MPSFRNCCVIVILVVAAIYVSGFVFENKADGRQFGDPFGNALSDGPKVSFTAEFKLKKDSRVGLLFLKASILPNNHVYSITQPKGGPLRSIISAVESDQFKFLGDFESESAPYIDDARDVFDVNIEYHKDKVNWFAPIEIAEGVDPESVTIDLVFNGQVCQVNQKGDTIGCLDLSNMKAQAKFSGVDEGLKVPISKSVQSSSYVPTDAHVEFSARIVNQRGDKSAIQPGDTVILEFTASPTDNFHIYQYAEKVIDGDNATYFAFNAPKNWSISKAIPSSKPYENKELDYWGHDTAVTWKFEIAVPGNTSANTYIFDGAIAYQTCSDEHCDMPSGLLFRLEIPVSIAPFASRVLFIEDIQEAVVKHRVKNGWNAPRETKSKSASDRAPLSKTPASTTEVPDPKIEPTSDDILTADALEAMKALYDPNSRIEYIRYEEMDDYPIGTYVSLSDRARKRESSLYLAVLGMFFGGLLLNLMPCVFPVLGLKVLGFVEQAGSAPSKIRLHGIAFSLGLLVSMWILAGFILTLKLVLGQKVSWGAEQMGNPYFVLAIIVLLFLLGLNMAGVYELGTSLTRVGGNVDGKKGYSSSFLTGVLTTIIATPCSGPFLAPAMGYTLSQTAELAMLLFTIFGLGIAMPYIVLCFFPALISALPRPGAWMHTFKIIMAFAMFAAVAFFMKTFGTQTGVDGLAWLAMALVVIGLAAFFYGTWSPAYVQPFKRLVFGWALPAIIMSIGIWMGYDAAGQQNTAVGNQMAGGLLWKNWQPGYIEYSLKTHPKIIWADYTAEWCLVCKLNKKTVFGSSDVKSRIEQLGVELVKVDYTDKSPDIAQDLSRSDQSIIPVNLVYPPNYPTEPAILLTGIMTPGQALKVFDRMEAVQKWIADGN
jgi:thiol:disulfide interchange protein DsbD